MFPLPLEVYSGDVEDHSLEPEDHEEALREGAVSDALAIAAGLHAQTMSALQPCPICFQDWFLDSHSDDQ